MQCTDVVVKSQKICLIMLIPNPEKSPISEKRVDKERQVNHQKTKSQKLRPSGSPELSDKYEVNISFATFITVLLNATSL